MAGLALTNTNLYTGEIQKLIDQLWQEELLDFWIILSDSW